VCQVVRLNKCGWSGGGRQLDKCSVLPDGHVAAKGLSHPASLCDLAIKAGVRGRPMLGPPPTPPPRRDRPEMTESSAAMRICLTPACRCRRSNVPERDAICVTDAFGDFVNAGLCCLQQVNRPLHPPRFENIPAGTFRAPWPAGGPESVCWIPPPSPRHPTKSPARGSRGPMTRTLGPADRREPGDPSVRTPIATAGIDNEILPVHGTERHDGP